MNVHPLIPGLALDRDSGELLVKPAEVLDFMDLPITAAGEAWVREVVVAILREFYGEPCVEVEDRWGLAPVGAAEGGGGDESPRG